MTWGRDERTRLTPVLGAARRELRDRDPDDVPMRLRKVAASSARTLPPPLEKALVDGLVSDDDFRSAVADRLEDATLDDVSKVFLDDPSAAIELARTAIRRDAEAAQDRAAEAQRSRIVELEAQFAEARGRIAELREVHAKDLSHQRSADRSARERLAERARTAEGEADDLRRRISELERERADLHAALDAARSALEEERRRNANDPRDDSTRVATSPGVVPTDPAELGRLLDRVERIARPYRHAESPDRPAGTVEAIRFPRGVTPDSIEAVEYLGVAAVDLVIVDGYNLAGLVVNGDFHRRDGRERVATIATALRRHARASVTVVFDAVDVDGRRRRSSDLGVDLVFAQDRSADDEIVDIVAASRARIVVVTNDRELRENVERKGATVIWSTAVADWSNR